MTQLMQRSELFIVLTFIFFVVALAFREQTLKLISKGDENTNVHPAILVFPENDNFRFDFASARPKKNFIDSLDKVYIPLLDQKSRDHGFDAIMVIGHTDGAPVLKSYRRHKQSNLDTMLYKTLSGSAPDSLMQMGSNVDLGMMRAVAIINVLKKRRQFGYLKSIRYWLPYSAGQIIDTNHLLIFDVDTDSSSARRRIEIILYQRNFEDMRKNPF